MRSVEEEACEAYYKNTTKRDESGRYTVHLTFNGNKKKSVNRDKPHLIVFVLKHKFDKNSILKTQYFESIQSYSREGHMTPVNNEELSNRGFFLPHRAVLKANSLTTKTRVVFDGSCKSSSGVSLNVLCWSVQQFKTTSFRPLLVSERFFLQLQLI